MWFKQSLLGLAMTDRLGTPVGHIEETWPDDGGGEPEFAIVRLGRFGERRAVPVSCARIDDEGVCIPYLWVDVYDAPSVENGRYLRETIDMSRGWWQMDVDYDRSGFDSIVDF